MGGRVDTILTVVLFVALLPAVVVAVFVGLHLLMLGDAVTEKGLAMGRVGRGSRDTGISDRGLCRGRGAGLDHPWLSLLHSCPGAASG